ncbi:murein L,D-transpeptidase [Periweissella cryptocerci]|uniref:Murein L,D-transpeptidase n=1 Tax=Periweissella cryptocerci TaxID=2506420 RepID=A0A4P6YTB0_9LACO|nr:L,D-transpeptidase family protein [Periweissella cryptocerci]QBO35916.1 murein L,D-transpeptidase [Periweissella cryptocerci]
MKKRLLINLGLSLLCIIGVGLGLSTTITAKTTGDVPAVAKATGYRLVNQDAQVWTKPYIAGLDNVKSENTKQIQGYMIRLTEQVKINGTKYYLGVFPGSGKSAGWIKATDLKTPQYFWTKATGGKYINVKKTKNLNVEVSLKKQRVYLKSGHKVVYTMMASTGKKTSKTPKGHYTLHSGGKWFWSAAYGGAKYWREFAAGGYYFHTIDTVSPNGKYSVVNGNKLGQAVSHGCVRLSIADAKWFYKNMPNGVKVYVH